MAFIRNDQADVEVTVWDKHDNPVKLFGPWATYSGAELSSNSVKTRPGAMGQEFDVGGQGTRSDATLTIQWGDEVVAKLGFLESRVGKGKVKISITWLDREGDAIRGGGSPDTGMGILKSASRPAYDHNGNAVGFLTITVGMHEQAA